MSILHHILTWETIFSMLQKVYGSVEGDKAQTLKVTWISVQGGEFPALHRSRQPRFESGTQTKVPIDIFLALFKLILEVH